MIKIIIYIQYNLLVHTKRCCCYILTGVQSPIQLLLARIAPKVTSTQPVLPGCAANYTSQLTPVTFHGTANMVPSVSGLPTVALPQCSERVSSRLSASIQPHVTSTGIPQQIWSLPTASGNLQVLHQVAQVTPSTVPLPVMNTSVVGQDTSVLGVASGGKSSANQRASLGGLQTPNDVSLNTVLPSSTNNLMWSQIKLVPTQNYQTDTSVPVALPIASTDVQYQSSSKVPDMDTSLLDFCPQDFKVDTEADFGTDFSFLDILLSDDDKLTQTNTLASAQVHVSATTSSAATSRSSQAAPYSLSVDTEKSVDLSHVDNSTDTDAKTTAPDMPVITGDLQLGESLPDDIFGDGDLDDLFCNFGNPDEFFQECCGDLPTNFLDETFTDIFDSPHGEDGHKDGIVAEMAVCENNETNSKPGDEVHTDALVALEEYKDHPVLESISSYLSGVFDDNGNLLAQQSMEAGVSYPVRNQKLSTVECVGTVLSIPDEDATATKCLHSICGDNVTAPGSKQDSPKSRKRKRTEIKDTPVPKRQKYKVLPKRQKYKAHCLDISDFLVNPSAITTNMSTCWMPFSLEH